MQSFATDFRNLLTPPASPRTDQSRQGHGESVLCVHFNREWDEYSIWLAGADDSAATPPDLRFAWQMRPSGVAWAEASNRHAVACDAVLLDIRHTGATWQQVRDLLRVEGVPRQCAAILARLPERPLLATFARGPVLSTDMVRQIHQVLLTRARVSTVPF